MTTDALTPSSFIAFATSLRDLGAVQVSAGPFAVTFAAPQRGVVAPLPRAVRPPQGTEDDTPEARKAFRDHVRETLAHG